MSHTQRDALSSLLFSPLSSLLQIVLPLIRKKLLTEYAFDIRKLNLLPLVRRCYTPVLFLHALDDMLVPQSQTLSLFSHYGERVGERNGFMKRYLEVEGGHNDPRPAAAMELMGEFLSLSLRLPFIDLLIPHDFSGT